MCRNDYCRCGASHTARAARHCILQHDGLADISAQSDALVQARLISAVLCRPCGEEACQALANLVVCRVAVDHAQSCLLAAAHLPLSDDQARVAPLEVLDEFVKLLHSDSRLVVNAPDVHDGACIHHVNDEAKLARMEAIEQYSELDSEHAEGNHDNHACSVQLQGETMLVETVHVLVKEALQQLRRPCIRCIIQDARRGRSCRLKEASLG